MSTENSHTAHSLDIDLDIHSNIVSPYMYLPIIHFAVFIDVGVSER